MELLLAQGAGGAVLPSEALELGHQRADGGFHDAEEKVKKKTTKKDM